MRWEVKEMHLEAEDMPLDIIFENEDFAVINKDPGINTHPTPGEDGRKGTLVNALLHVANYFELFKNFLPTVRSEGVLERLHFHNYFLFLLIHYSTSFIIPIAGAALFISSAWCASSSFFICAS